jgi:hypothetical protein
VIGLFRKSGSRRSAQLPRKPHPVRALLLAFLALATALSTTTLSPALAEEAIEDFSSEVVLHRDGTVLVTETIRVRAEGIEIKRGIYRDIPTTVRDAEGRGRCIDFNLLSVTRDGQPEPHFTEQRGDFTRIYAGDKNVFLSVGSYTYVLTFETDHQISWTEDRPQLIWDVTGDWDFPIKQTTFRLTLPSGVAPVRWDAYTGDGGERGTDFKGGVTNGTLRVEATRTLGQGQSLTVVTEIPTSSVDKPTDPANCEYARRGGSNTERYSTARMPPFAPSIGSSAVDG